MAETSAKGGSATGTTNVAGYTDLAGNFVQAATLVDQTGNGDDVIGDLTAAAPSTDTASASINGRLQRVAQRITSLIALLPAALGTGGGLKVDGSGTALPVSGTVSVGNFPATQPVSLATAVTIKPNGVTPAAATASAIVTGGTAVTLVTGPCNGGYITNPPNLASQGIVAAENAYVDPVGTPGSTDSTANGTCQLLEPGQSFTIPPLASGSVIRGNAATSGHKLTVVVW